MSVSSPIIQFKRGSASLISSGIVSFRQGEPGFTTDKYDFYIGSDETNIGNKFFGSSRYWTRENGTKSARINLVNKEGTNYVSLACTDGHSGITTYTLPSSPIDGYSLTTDANGNLSWTNELRGGTFTGNVAFTSTTVSTSSSTGAVVITGGLGVGGTSYFGDDLNVGGDLNVTGITSINSSGFLDVNSNADFSGITTFSSTENNVLGDENTGAVQIDGGVGIAKNLTVKQNFYVGGVSEFVGIVTFKGGTINLGDENTDNINVSGEFISNLTPNADNTYDIGITTQRWRDARFSGIGSFATGVYADKIEIGINNPSEIKGVDGSIQLVASDHVTISNDLHVNGNVTIGGTTVTLLGEDVFVRNKDIILGYTTSVTGQDISNDDTANHAGVAIASTEGTPLVSFAVSGINTLPDTYKQLMWFQKNTLGFATDIFGFNYGVAIGTTTVADGVRLAVGSGIRMTDSNITASGDIAVNGGDVTTTNS
ncbi:MAG: Synechococcus phage, partial [Bacteroidota bacterium]